MKLGTTVFVLLAALPLAVRSDFVLTIFIFTFISSRSSTGSWP